MGVIRVLEVKEQNFLTGDNGPMVSIPAWLFLFLCLLVVGARVWSRMRTDGGLGSDDYTIIASLVFAIATHIIGLWGCANGYGKHAANLTEHQATDSFKSFYLAQITYKISLCLTKSSILLLYLRIFGGVKWFRRTCYVLLIIIGSYYTAATMVTIFQCNPVVAAFDKNVTNSKCINIGPFWYTNAVLSITSDVVILLMPMPLIYALQMSRLKKSALIFVFALGTLVVVASILRFPTLDLPVKSPDPLYDIKTAMWTMIEMSLAIICACLPQIRPLATKLLFPKVKSACCNLKNKLRPVKPDSDPRQASDGEEEKWTHIASQNGVKLTNVICRGDAGAGIPSADEGVDRKTKILKTMDYTLEYSKSRANS
ncbi:hypothetical protein F4782DRAFT_528677 [Xylaria castorea]|nr:hypothetical protein F4782DRAFT_528677 [Xylaria castorea]